MTGLHCLDALFLPAVILEPSVSAHCVLFNVSLVFITSRLEA